MTQQESDAHILMPKQDVFRQTQGVDRSIIYDGQTFLVYERAEYPKEGGIYVHYKGTPYPRKGFPFPEAIHANDQMKRLTLAFVKTFVMKEMLLPFVAFAALPWFVKIRIANRAIEHYLRVVDWTIRDNFLVAERYCNTSRAVRKAAKDFLLVLGITPSQAGELAEAVACIMEYDDAYRFRLQDILGETRQFELALRPFGEIRRLGRIYASRERIHALANVRPMFTMAAVAFLHPRVRKAWRVAIGSLTPKEFGWLKLDNADRYHVLKRDDYDFVGKTFAERAEIYKNVHRASFCCKAKVTPFISVVGGPKAWRCSNCGKETEEGYAFPPEIKVAPQ